MDPLSRREFIQTAFALGATAAISGVSGKPSTTIWHERRDLFPEGVASAEPTFDSVLLWTRYPAGIATTAATQPHATEAGPAGQAAITEPATQPHAAGSSQSALAAANDAATQARPASSRGAGGLTSAALTVEVATDPAFRNVVATSTANVTAAS